MDHKEHTIDASGRTLGRVASEAAKALMGKTSAAYTPHHLPTTTVTITNASKLYVRDAKALVKRIQSYSGYPGGQRTESMKSLTTRRGYGVAVRLAISSMLPKNTQKVQRMKNLTIHE